MQIFDYFSRLIIVNFYLLGAASEKNISAQQQKTQK
jgi:hypothetical protein